MSSTKRSSARAAHRPALSRRPESVASLVRAELSRLLLQEMRDPRLGFVTVADVVMSADLRHARVFVSVMGGGDSMEQTMAALESAHGFLRRALGRSLGLRFTPEIAFFPAVQAPLASLFPSEACPSSGGEE